MKEFAYQKFDNEGLLLLTPIDFLEWSKTLDNLACYIARFTAASSNKTHEQLGWYYAGIVPDVIAGLRDLGWCECGHKEFLGTRIPLELNTENVDDLLKTVYAISRGVPVPSKACMSKETMSDFIEVILLWAADNNLEIRPPTGTL